MKAIVLFTAVLFLVGCANDPRPAYVAPVLDEGKVSVIKCEGSMFVDGVDGAKVEGMKFSMLGGGGNTVRVLPGERALRFTWQSGNSSASWNVKHTFTAGHKYTVGPDNWMMPSAIKVVDQNTKVSVLLK